MTLLTDTPPNMDVGTSRAAERAKREYRVCTRCIMDTSDPLIAFDEQGVCSNCYAFGVRLRQTVIADPEIRKLELANLISRIVAEGRHKRYDCVIGVSGGGDSTYVALLARQFGLRPLAFHLDNGWNSELAVANIERALSKLKIDLCTHVLDWDEFSDLQLAFLRASTPDGEIPTDHAIQAALYETAVREGVRYVIVGTNTATEGLFPASWAQGHGDWRYIRSVHSRFGRRKLNTFPHLSPTKLFRYRFVTKLIPVSLLDYIAYDKAQARQILEKELQWREYGGKHFESVYTRFFQGYVLPKKFGINKKRAHLSSLILSSQMSREEALVKVEESDYPDELQSQDRDFVIKKLRITEEEFHEIMKSPIRTFWDYPSYKRLMTRLGFMRFYRLVRYGLR